MSQTSQQETASKDLGIVSARSVGCTLLLAVLILVTVEALLQVRSHLRTGRSVWSTLTSTSLYVQSEELGIRLLRPSAEVGGRSTSIRTNSLGLRGDELPAERPPDEYWVALLGASTIMGPFATSNEFTSAALLEQALREKTGSRKIRVINAGIAGLKIHEQVVLLSRRLLPVGISILFWYPGMNDIRCTGSDGESDSNRVAIPVPELPRWVLTDDLLIKNTSALRRSAVSGSQGLVAEFDPDRISAEIERGLAILKDNGVQAILVTSAASFDVDTDSAHLHSRAASALAHRPCYSAIEFAKDVSVFNETLRQVGASNGIPVVDAATQLGTRADLFIDSTHFSREGEQNLAKLLLHEIEVEGIATPVGFEQ